MVFASNIFILFMAVVLPIFALFASRNAATGKYLLIALSLFFYSYWLPIYLVLILASIGFNFTVARWILNQASDKIRKRATVFGLAANLLLLGYFKYYGFFVENINFALGIDSIVPKIALPLGISFFTFQQVSFLVEVYKRKVKHVDFANYVLFISFFPQLIAGPIVTQSEMLPQLDRKKTGPCALPCFRLAFFCFRSVCSKNPS